MSENPPAHAAHTALRAGRRQTGHSLPLVLADSESFPCKLRPHHALWISTHCTLQISTLTRVEIGSLHSRTPTHHGVYPPWAPRSVTRRTICDTMYVFTNCRGEVDCGQCRIFSNSTPTHQNQTPLQDR